MGARGITALKVAWALFAIGWSLVCAFAFVLGAGLSVAAHGVEPAFLLYWLVPILAPLALFRLFARRAGAGSRDDRQPHQEESS